MKILALDTSTEACSVALLPGAGAEVLSRYIEAPRGHAELLLPMVNELLAAAGLTLGELDALAFARGPGSFTGVRLAASVVQGLAFGAGIGVVPVSTLQAVARRALSMASPAVGGVLVCNDARMDEVYTAAFLRGTPLGLPERDRFEQGPPRLLGTERALSPQRVALPMATSDARPPTADPVRWIGAGHGFRAYPLLGELVSERYENLLPHAADVLALAMPEVAAGRVLAPAAALPVYVRDEVAKVPAAPAPRGGV